MDNPVKRGEYVVKESTYSATFVHGPTKWVTTWHVVKVASVTRDGLIKRAYSSPADEERPQSWEVAPYEIATVPDHQMRAAGMYAAGARYASKDAMIAAFKAETIDEALALAD